MQRPSLPKKIQNIEINLTHTKTYNIWPRNLINKCMSLELFLWKIHHIINSIHLINKLQKNLNSKKTCQKLEENKNSETKNLLQTKLRNYGRQRTYVILTWWLKLCLCLYIVIIIKIINIYYINFYLLQEQICCF